MKVRVYADFDLIEEILYDENKYEQMCHILWHHTDDLCINLDDDSFNKAISKEENFIFNLFHSRGGSGIDNYPHAFQQIKDEPEAILKEEKAIFLLDLPDTDIEKYQNQFGAPIFNKSTLISNVLNLDFEKNLDKGEEFENKDKKGWKELLNLSIQVS